MKNWILKHRLKKKLRYQKIFYVARKSNYNNLVTIQINILIIYGINDVLNRKPKFKMINRLKRGVYFSFTKIINEKSFSIRSKLKWTSLVGILLALILFLNSANKSHKGIYKYQLPILEPINRIVKIKSCSHYYIDLYQPTDPITFYLSRSPINDREKTLDMVQWLDKSKRQNLMSSSGFIMELKRYKYSNSLEQFETQIRRMETASKRTKNNTRIPLSLRTQTLSNIEKKRQAELVAQEKIRLYKLSNQTPIKIDIPIDNIKEIISAVKEVLPFD